MGTGTSPLGSGGGTNISADKAAKIVDKTGFKDEGGGQWTLDIPGVGGAQILDETGSSKALRMGLSPSTRLYSMMYWDKDYNMRDYQYYETLNDAKYSAKNSIKETLE